MTSEVVVKTGDEVAEGDKLVVLEAMKMLTTVSPPKPEPSKKSFSKKANRPTPANSS